MVATDAGNRPSSVINNCLAGAGAVWFCIGEATT
ncbi:hypothetical protein JYK04_04346 [Streptomyces nojiriensis]|nr:hypothetical protein JYK04_04346 [Streptomyces nojiriensis]